MITGLWLHNHIHASISRCFSRFHLLSHGGLQCCSGILSIEERRLGTEKPKVAGGDRLEHQRTLEDSILSVLATRGERSPSTMAIVVNGGATEAKSMRSIDPLYAFDPEIENTLRRLRRTRNLIVDNSRSYDFVIDSDQFCTDNSVASSNMFTSPGQMENHDRTLKELATPDVSYRRRPPQASQGIPRGLFNDKAVGDTKGLYQNEGIPILPRWSCKRLAVSSASTLQHLGRHEAHLPGKILPSIQDCNHQKGNMWNPATQGETLHEYWEQFNKLCATCPYHQISEQLLIQYFYEGLSIMERSMIDAASGGALMDKTPPAARQLISNMARPNQSRMVNEIGTTSNQKLENQLTELTSLVRQLAVSQHQSAMVAKICGIGTFMEHPTDMCPTLQENESDQPKHVRAMGGFQYGKQQYQT
ncbi:hypothetical protein CR513_49937, partial [Mucuna pruriens]